jgi:hypothetical protein
MKRKREIPHEQGHVIPILPFNPKADFVELVSVTLVSRFSILGCYCPFELAQAKFIHGGRKTTWPLQERSEQ